MAVPQFLWIVKPLLIVALWSRERATLQRLWRWRLLIDVLVTLVPRVVLQLRPWFRLVAS
jgi:hypothetical protein